MFIEIEAQLVGENGTRAYTVIRVPIGGVSGYRNSSSTEAYRSLMFDIPELGVKDLVVEPPPDFKTGIAILDGED